jgi:hypothetical protein
LPTASNNPCAANHGNPLQLLFNFGTMLKKRLINSLSQVHKGFNGHSSAACDPYPPEIIPCQTNIKPDIASLD